MGFFATQVVESGSSATPVSASPRTPRGPIFHVESGYRFYRPEMGRWTKRDPLSESGAALEILSRSSSGKNARAPAMRTMFASGGLMSSLISSVLVPAERDTHLFTLNNPVNKSDYLGLVCSVPLTAYDCKCPIGLRHRPTYIKTENGCSNPYFQPPFTDNPSGLPGCSFKDACDKHDCCYGLCNSSKAGCDAAFYGRMLSKCLTCAGWNPIALLSCTNWASAYYSAVTTGGSSAYNKNQTDACESCCCI